MTTKSAFLSKTKLEGLIDMGAINLDVLAHMSMNAFPSKQDPNDIMVAITPKVDVELEERASDKETITKEAMQAMLAMGLLNREAFETDLQWTPFTSSFGKKGELVSISRKTSHSLDELMNPEADAGRTDVDAGIFDAGAGY